MSCPFTLASSGFWSAVAGAAGAAGAGEAAIAGGMMKEEASRAIVATAFAGLIVRMCKKP
ncbi:hypothetical protein AA15237_2898 [Komagataeibacter xylinus NBRC 15237]|nr:hypothetical protein AA15237_2898 [Komagataeibacter xylinus NBRC 15237]GBR14966.1 hypothetical protein AA0616_0442 [Komagataeibacter nataicola NRIC 0616]